MMGYLGKLRSWLFQKPHTSVSSNVMKILHPGVWQCIEMHCNRLSAPPELEVGVVDDFNLIDKVFCLYSQVCVHTSGSKTLLSWMRNDEYEKIKEDIKRAFNDLWYYHNAI